VMKPRKVYKVVYCFDGKRWSAAVRAPGWMLEYHVNRPTVPTVQQSCLYAFKDYHSALLFMRDYGSCRHELWECDGIVVPVPRVVVVSPYAESMDSRMAG